VAERTAVYANRMLPSFLAIIFPGPKFRFNRNLLNLECRNFNPSNQFFVSQSYFAAAVLFVFKMKNLTHSTNCL